MAALRTILAHGLCLFSMALYAGNYVSMEIFARQFSGFFFNIVRTIMTIPVIPLLIACSSLYNGYKAEELQEVHDYGGDNDNDGANQQEIPPHRELSNSTVQKKIEEAWTYVHHATLPIDYLRYPPINEQHAMKPEPLSSTLSDCCSTTPDATTRGSGSTSELIRPSCQETEDGNDEENSFSVNPENGAPRITNSSSRQLEFDQHHRKIRHNYVLCRSAISCAKNGELYQMCFFCCLSTLRSYTLHPRAQWPVLLSTVSGCVRQMVVPIALMFTTANAAGIIQPAVPVFSAFIAIGYGLEKFCWMTFVSVLFCGVGLFISEEGWEGSSQVNTGFLLLLIVPISKGFQIVGTQLASPYCSSHVIQTYQIVGLIVLTFPVAIVLELALIRHWDVFGMLADFAKLNSASWFAILFTVIGILVVAWKIQIFCIKEFGSVGVSLYQSFQPLFTFLFARWFLDEPVDRYQVIGASVVCLGLVVYLSRKYLDHQEKLRQRMPKEQHLVNSAEEDMRPPLITAVVKSVEQEGEGPPRGYHTTSSSTTLPQTVHGSLVELEGERSPFVGPSAHPDQETLQQNPEPSQSSRRQRCRSPVPEEKMLFTFDQHNSVPVPRRESLGEKCLLCCCSEEDLIGFKREDDFLCIDGTN